MRPILGDTYDELQLANATRPAILLEVYWTGLANNPLRYSDQNLNVDIHGTPEVPGYIIQISSLASLIQHNQRGISGSLSVTLADPDGSLKTLWDAYDIHKVPVAVFQTFANDLTLKGFLFQGEITTPLAYNDADRTLTFNVTASVELKEYGFSAEQGYFRDLAPEAVDKAWPLCFGSPLNVPAQKITSLIKGESLTTYGIVSHNDVENLLTLAQTYQEAKTRYDRYQNADSDELADWSVNELSKLTLEMSDAEIAYREGIQKLATNTGRDLAALYTAIENYSLTTAQDRDNEISISIVDDKLATETKKLDQATLWQFQSETLGNAWNGLNHPYDETRALAILAQIEAGAKINQLTLDREALIAFRDTYAARRLTDFAALEIARKEITKFDLSSIKVANGKRFPQNTDIRINVNNLILWGRMNGNTFTVQEKDISTYRHVKFGTRINSYYNEFQIKDASIKLKNSFCLIRTPWDETFPYCVVYVTEQYGTRCMFKPIIFRDDGAGVLRPIRMGDTAYNGSEHEIMETCPIFKPMWYNYIDRTVPAQITGLTPDLQAMGWAVTLGDTITLYDEDYRDVYVANILESNEVFSVSAYRQVNNLRKLTPIPSSYYTIDLDQVFGDLTCTTISFKVPLSQYEGELWEDSNIYVTLESSVGPNIVDIITHLVDTYTDLDVDATTFGDVSTTIANYPANFALIQRGNVLDLIEEIAWQSRCATYIRNGVMYIKYLADAGTEVGSVATDDIIADSVKILYSETENLCTKMVATWQPSYDKPQNKIILRNNIARYGKIEQSFDFYIYNNEELVRKSATFWLLRFSSTWKRISFETPLHKLPWEAYDTVLVNIPVLYDGNVVCMVEEANYDPGNMRIAMTIWTPIRAGEYGAYELAYPANVSTSLVYPTATDSYAGGATGGHVVNSGGTYTYSDRANDVGTQILSDIADTLPEIVAESYGQIDALTQPTTTLKPGKVEVRLDIANTKIVDTRTGFEAPLNDILAITKQQQEDASQLSKLSIKTTTTFVAPTEEVGSLLMEHDGTDFRAFDPLLGHE